MVSKPTTSFDNRTFHYSLLQNQPFHRRKALQADVDREKKSRRA
jgi:hypothetical protein